MPKASARPPLRVAPFTRINEAGHGRATAGPGRGGAARGGAAGWGAGPGPSSAPGAGAGAGAGAAAGGGGGPGGGAVRPGAGAVAVSSGRLSTRARGMCGRSAGREPRGVVRHGPAPVSPWRPAPVLSPGGGGPVTRVRRSAPRPSHGPSSGRRPTLRSSDCPFEARCVLSTVEAGRWPHILRCAYPVRGIPRPVCRTPPVRPSAGPSSRPAPARRARQAAASASSRASGSGTDAGSNCRTSARAYCDLRPLWVPMNRCSRCSSVRSRCAGWFRKVR